MADITSFQIPENPTFAEALQVSQALLEQMAMNSLTTAEIQAAIASLVATEDGARGFFVVYLSDEREIADSPTVEVLEALRTAPQIVSPLLIKNLAMSTGMAISHRRNQNQDQAKGSDRVQRRTTELIQQLQIGALKEHAIALINTIRNNSGPYEDFLKRWNYDAEQQKAIHHALEAAMGE